MDYSRTDHDFNDTLGLCGVHIYMISPHGCMLLELVRVIWKPAKTHWQTRTSPFRSIESSTDLLMYMTVCDSYSCLNNVLLYQYSKISVLFLELSTLTQREDKS